MKFTQSLKLNAKHEWREHYLDYATLKKLIYEAEPSYISPRTIEDLEALPLESATAREVCQVNVQSVPTLQNPFKTAIDGELSRMNVFYELKEAHILEQLNALAQQVEALERVPLQTTRSGRTSANYGSLFRNTDDIEATVPATVPVEAPLLGPGRESMDGAAAGKPDGEFTSGAKRTESGALVAGLANLRRSLWKQTSAHEMTVEAERLKMELTDLYVELSELQSYVEMNTTGLRKILKKHDKVLGQHLREQYMSETVANSTMVMNKAVLEGAMARLVEAFSALACQGDIERASLVLKRNLRERIVFERNTVWKDMVEKERRALTAILVRPGRHPVHDFYHRNYQAIALGFSVAVFAALLSVNYFGGDGDASKAKNNCLALLVFVSLLWCTEAIPLFVTSMLVPFLAVTLRVMVDGSSDPPQRFSPTDTADRVFHAMFSQVIMLLLGGFAIAAALSKYNIAKSMAVAILSRVGTAPQHVLLANMLVATFASMWISNVAAPVLCYSLLQPILRTLPSRHPFGKALVLGIALASNLGGMTSPISSPQNLFAIQQMSIGYASPSWLAWFFVSLPLALLGNFACWGILLVAYQPWRHIEEVHRLPPLNEPYTRKQWFVIAVSAATVLLWCFNSVLQQWTGEMGIVAILPLFAFFGFGILGKDDFNNFLWNVVMLAMGGLALGEAVTSSGLLHAIATGVQEQVGGMGLWHVLAIFCALVLVCTTFISHTVGAIIILPIVQSVGSQMCDGQAGCSPHPRLLVMGAALMCSGAMGLPVSGFPNMTAVSLEDATGLNWVTTGDFLRVGILCSICAYCLITTLGYVLMLIVGF